MSSDQKCISGHIILRTTLNERPFYTIFTKNFKIYFLIKKPPNSGRPIKLVQVTEEKMGTLEPETKPGKDGLPNFWELLSDQDKAGYKALKNALDASSGKRNRGHRIEAFDNILEAIHRFAERHDENDWRRFLVCGVCWMDNMVAINTRQLRLLISKCKSSINGSFQKLGYSTNQSHTESWKFLFDRIPLLKDNFNELRQWTIRCRIPGNQPIVAYADGQNCIVPQDPGQPIQMQISVPQFSQAAMRSDSHPVQLNLLIPPGVIDNRLAQSAIVQSQVVPPPIITMQQIPQIQAQQAQQIIPQGQQPQQQVSQMIDLTRMQQQVPVKEGDGGIPLKKQDGSSEPYCPLKFRSRLMHRQDSKELK